MKPIKTDASIRSKEQTCAICANPAPAQVSDYWLCYKCQAKWHSEWPGISRLHLGELAPGDEARLLAGWTNAWVNEQKRGAPERPLIEQETDIPSSAYACVACGDPDAWPAWGGRLCFEHFTACSAWLIEREANSPAAKVSGQREWVAAHREQEEAKPT